MNRQLEWEIEEELKSNKETIQSLEKRIEELENKIKNFKGFIYPPSPKSLDFENPWRMPDINPINNPWKPPLTCNKCGLDLSGITGYCCQDINCPSGLGPTLC